MIPSQHAIPAPSAVPSSLVCPAPYVPPGVPSVPRRRGTPSPNGVHPEPVRRVPEQFGPLRPLLRDGTVTDVFVNPGGDVWADRGAGPALVRSLHLDTPTARRLATTLVAVGDRHVDEATPCADVRLADGIRVHVVLPPVSRGGAAVSIRAPSILPLSLDDLDAAGLFECVPRQRVEQLVRDRVNILVTGAGGSGKTTLLGALLGAAPPTERIVTLEDVAELRIDHPHVVALETRQPNLEGAGAIDLARLVREALRMRPDRLVVGECRGAEVRELLSALNTGHDGGAGTLHANGLDSVAARLEAVGALAGLLPEALARQAVSAFGAVVHLERTTEGRRITGLATLAIGPDARLNVVEA
ncbi:TadA family conjugal transfer-associated ATPase [Frondihabitans peucedani]|uniref:Bacterial type II secretion system protein E domain-containing protein n=1 Tax=Frondihabitans peucedani TaxID=598626 RepID=A0ABP8DZR4_9MICO